MASMDSVQHTYKSPNGLWVGARAMVLSPKGGAPWQWPATLVAGLLLGAASLAAFRLPSPWGYLPLVLLLGSFVAMAAGQVRRLLLATIILDIPFHLGTHLDYHLEAAAVGTVAGLSLSITTVSLLALYALWIAELLARRETAATPNLRAALPAALYVAFAGISVTRASYPTYSLFELFVLVELLLLYIYVASTVRSRRDVLFILGVLFAGLVLEGAVMLSMRFGAQSVSIFGLSARMDLTSSGGARFYRVAGTVGSPNEAASYLTLLLAPAVAILLARVSPSHKLLAAVALALGGVALLLTFSRGGWAAFTLSLTLLCVAAWRRGWLSPFLPLVVAGVGVALALVFQETVLSRLTDSVATQGRFPLIEIAFRMIQSHPLLGIGANNFGLTMKQYVTPELNGQWLYTVHNKYLLVWSETGIGGLLAFLLFLGATLRQGWQVWRHRDPFLSLLALGFTTAVAGQMVHMMVDIFNDRQQLQLLWLIAALIAAMASMIGSQQAPEMTRPLGQTPNGARRRTRPLVARPAGRWPHGA